MPAVPLHILDKHIQIQQIIRFQILLKTMIHKECYIQPVLCYKTYKIRRYHWQHLENMPDKRESKYEYKDDDDGISRKQLNSIFTISVTL